MFKGNAAGEMCAGCDRPVQLGQWKTRKGWVAKVGIEQIGIRQVGGYPRPRAQNEAMADEIFMIVASVGQSGWSSTECRGRTEGHFCCCNVPAPEVLRLSEQTWEDFASLALGNPLLLLLLRVKGRRQSPHPPTPTSKKKKSVKVIIPPSI